MKDKNKKILLIYPSNNHVNLEKGLFLKHRKRPLIPPIELMYLASIAEQVGYNAKIKDYRFGGNFINDLLEFKPDFLVVTCSTQTFKFDLETILLAKNNLPTITTIAIGTPFWTYNKNVTYENPYIDYVIFGEAEYALKEILSGEENRNILGISYSENMQTIKNDLRPHLEDLNELPFPARHLIDNSKYKNFNNKELAVIQISRGCPFNRFYDLKSSITGFNIRLRSIDNIINEIQEYIEKYNINNFLFQTENFNFDKEWAMNFCKRILESKIKITWETSLFPNNIDEDLIKTMRQAGCKLINFDIESGSQDILNNIDKNLTINTILNVIKIIKKYKIKIFNSFLIGLPWETEKTLKETVDFISKSKIDYFNFNLAIPYPGTRFFAYALFNKLIGPPLDYSNASEYPIMKTHELTKEQLQNCYKQLLAQKFSKKIVFANFIYKLKKLIRK